MTERDSTAQRGLVMAVVACVLVGAAIVAGTLMFGRERAAETDARIPVVATEEYGRRLLADTSALLGPDHADPRMRYSGSRLACGSCHLGTGAEPGTLTLLQASEHYPRFSGRVGASTDIEDRVNECMQRSMNGRPLPMDSAEMMAMAAYIRSLGARYAAMGASARRVQEPPAFGVPSRAADLTAGALVYQERCRTCHGPEGAGLLATPDPKNGYLFPPLWGPDSFNDGAGMHRVLTAARFVKARMPLGKADLDDGQAFDVAAYISAQPRPAMANLDRDYPDRTTKPVDSGYPPFADPFPLEQHRFGPYGPIEAYYKALKESK